MKYKNLGKRKSNKRSYDVKKDDDKDRKKYENLFERIRKLKTIRKKN
jgi:hypothetical protein